MWKMTLTMVLALTTLLSSTSSVGAHPGTLYWSESQAGNELLQTTWAKRLKIRSEPLCNGAGAHIHSADGIPLFRHFVCIDFVTTKKRSITPVWIWLHATTPPTATREKPLDLWDNPLAPVPPTGFRTRFWNVGEAFAKLLATGDVKDRGQMDRKFSWCNGIGFHYHLVGTTVFSHFRCVVSLKIKFPKLKPGEAPSLKWLRDALKPPADYWLSTQTNGSVIVSRTRPQAIWQR